MKPRPSPEPSGLHPRNRHQGRYDFEKLTALRPELAAFVAPNPYGDLSVDFANPEAVKALNRALLTQYYGITYWDIPPGFLCPPIPGRADYLHRVADLLAESNAGVVPRGDGIRVLDIGVGANCVYPVVGRGEYGWSFTGADIDPVALESARRIVEANPGLAGGVTLHLQKAPASIFGGLFSVGERFALTVCNPPFHGSAEEAGEGSQRKWRNLGKASPAGKSPALNFGGQSAELWCPGGEAGFVRRMIGESAALGDRCLWFTTLIAKSIHLPAVYAALERAGAVEVRTLEMSQGQKKSRVVAWSFLRAAQRKL